MITIEHLEVRFDVEGEDEDQTFKRKFEKCIRLWQRARQVRLDGDRERIIGPVDREEQSL